MKCSLDNTRTQMIDINIIDADGFLKMDDRAEDKYELGRSKWRDGKEILTSYQREGKIEEARRYKESVTAYAKQYYVKKNFLSGSMKERIDKYAQHLKDTLLDTFGVLPKVPGKTNQNIEPFEIVDLEEGYKLKMNREFFDWVDKKNADKSSLKPTDPNQLKLFLQKESTSSTISNEDLNVVIKNFLNKVGVSYEAVEGLTDSQGNPIKGVALANILDKVIQVVEGKAGIDTLPEEAAHFFVAMLPKDSHLYQTMFKSITDYQIYSSVLDEYGEDPLYKGNTIKLKEEAMGKLIAQHIIKGFQGMESENNLQKANKWWNMLWEKIKKMFFTFDKKGFYQAGNQANAFQVTAEMIFKGDITELRGETNGDIFLQKSNDEAVKVKDTIESVSNRMSYDESKINKDKENKNSGYSIKSSENNNEVKDIKNRTTDIVEELKKKRNWSERTPLEKKFDKISADFGTRTHAAIKNIIDRYTEKLQDNEVTAKDTYGLSDSKYNQLSSYINKLLKPYETGSIILSEIKIYDKKKDLAGTIDLLIIKPDGTIDIFDWKTINMTGKTDIPFYKEEEWNVQLSSYKNTLKSYGLNKFGKIRIVPIATKFDRDMNLKEISIGGENLEQIPITGLQGGDVEFTGNESIDKLIEVLVQRLKKVYEVKVPYEDIKLRQLKTARIEKLKASIKELQLKQTYESFLDEAKFELNLMKESGLETYDNDELMDARRVATFYSRILEKGFVSKSILKDNYKEFSNVQTKASEMLADINSQIEIRAVKIAESVEINNLLEAQDEPTVLARWFRSISQSEHPVIKSFYKLVSNQKAKVYKESKELYSKIDVSIKDLKEWGKGQGLSGTDIFKPLLKFDNGKWTGNLISKFKSEVYEKRDQALKNKDQESLEFLKDSFTFDKEKFNKMREENIKTWNKLFKNDRNKEAIIKKKLNGFDTKYNVLTHPFTAYGKQNFLISVKDVWISDEYKKVMSIPALKNFYELFTSTINENKEYLDVNLYPSFVPNIRKDLIDGISQNGWNAITGLGESFSDAITAKSDADYGMVDETTGEYKKVIPIYYTESISPEMKSMDLGRSLYLFGNMVLNHKYMSEIEASSQILQDVLERRSKTIVTDALGNPIKGISGKIKEKLNSVDTLEQFNMFMDYYLYGINTTGTDKSISVNGKNISTKKLFSQTLKLYSAKSLSLNVLSGFANFFGGNTNALMEGSKGRFYTKSDYYNSIKLLASKKDLAFQAIEFFDIGSTHTDFQKAGKLSASNITKNMTFDKFYILQQAGEWTVENLTLLSMLQSHTIRNGKIVKKKTDETSLIDQMNVVNDKLEVPGLTDEEYAKFRRKVKYLYTTMKGNMSSEDINVIKLTVLGQVMMQFKNWIARMADERFGNLRYTQDLEVWEQGKYITWWKHAAQLTTGNFKNLLTGIAGNGILGIGSDMFNKSLTEAAEKHYDTLDDTQKTKISREEYAEMYAANIRASAAELQIMIVCAVLLAALKGGDDDKDAKRRYLIKMANRNLQEISFFINPKSAATITGSGAKTSVPILGLFVDIEEFFSDFIGQGVGIVTQDEERMDKNKPTKKFLNLFPAVNSLERLWEDFSDEE